MANASFSWKSFLGGIWTKSVQGRTDLPKYQTGMNVCVNGHPIEQGSWVRRPGFLFNATTRDGVFGRVIPFDFTAVNPYTMEFTAGFLRFFNGPDLVLDTPNTVSAISTQTPAVVGTIQEHGLTTGDQVEFLFPTSTNATSYYQLRNRQFSVIVLDLYTFTMTDPISGAAIDGSVMSGNPSDPAFQVARITTFATPWLTTAQLQALRSVQAQNGTTLQGGPGTTAYLLSGSTIPYALEVTSEPADDSFAIFSLTAQTFVDGPYLDPIQTNNITLTASGGSYIVTATNAIFTLVTDVGRLIRFFNTPQPWDSTVNYSVGDVVTFSDGNYYTVIGQVVGGGSGVDNSPLNNPVIWGLTPNGAVWVPAIITAVTSATECTVTLVPLTDPTTGVAIGLLYPTQTILTWMFGLYSNTTGWPTCGTFFEGRMFLGYTGSQNQGGNRFDTSMTDAPTVFSPTDVYGNVPDDSGISYILESGDVNTIYWMEPDTGGVIMGTKGGEWVVKASELSDPITPDSIQAHRVTKYGCENVLPQRTGLSLLFVRRYAHTLMEFITDVFTGKFSAPNLSFTAPGLMSEGIAELAHQEQLTPVIWNRMGDGSLKGVTYRRTASFATEEPVFAGWHEHILGSPQTLASICVGTSVGGDLDALTVVAQNTTPDGIYHVETLTDIFDENDTLFDANFVDDGAAPASATVVTYGGVSYMRFFGYYYLTGKTVSAWVCGLDLGDYTVQPGGYVDVPFGAANGLFTAAFVAQVAAGGPYTNYGLVVDTLTPATQVLPTSSPQTLQSYVGRVNNFSNQGQFPVPDWATQTLYAFYSGGVRVFNMATGLETFNATTSTVLGSAGQFGAGVNTCPFAISGNQIFCAVDGGDNCSRFVSLTVTPTGVTLNETFGAAGSSGEPTNGVNPPIAVAAEGGIIGIITASGGNTQFLAAAAGTGGSLGYIGYTSSDGMTFLAAGPNSFLGLQSPASPQSTISMGIYSVALGAADYADDYADWDAGTSYAPGTTSASNVKYQGVAYTAAQDSMGEIPSQQPTYWTVIPNPAITKRIITISATNIDPTWTHISNVTGIMYDQGSGCLLAGVQTNDSVTNRNYLVALRLTNGSTFWAIPMTSGALPGAASVMSQLLGGKYDAADSSNVWAVNTLLGTYVQYAIHGISVDGLQAFSDQLGWIVGHMAFTSTSGSPTLLNSTVSPFDVFAKLTVGTALTGVIPGVFTRSQIPGVIGYTYTSQAQLLRPSTSQETGALNGPPLGKIKRGHQFAALLSNSVAGTVSFGTSFNHLHVANYVNAGQVIYPKTTLLDMHTHWDTLDDEFNYDTMLCWQVTRPYPLCIMSMAGFLRTQDR